MLLASNIRIFIRNNIQKRPLYPISDEEGQMLCDTIIERGFKNGLEFGTGEGVSTRWLGLAMQKTGGRLTTIEADKKLSACADKTFEKENLKSVIRVWCGNAIDFLLATRETFDFIFLDAEKEDYAALLRLSLPRLKDGGLFAAHNVKNLRQHLKEFLFMIKNKKGLSTKFYESKAGISLTYKNTA